MADYSDKDAKRKSETVPFAEAEKETNSGSSKMPPPLQLGPQQSPVQKKEASPVQKADKEDGDKKDGEGEVDIDINVLPPSMQLAFWRFKLSADTGTAKLDYKQNDFSASLGYGYGSSLTLGAKKGPFSLGGSFNPGTLDFGAQAGYKQGPFNASLGYNSSKQEGSLSLGYGAPLLPMPDLLGSTMQAGGDAASSMMMQGPMAPLNDPMGYYSANKDNIGDITKAVSMAQKLAKEKKGIRFGAGVRLSASQLSGITIAGGLQGSF